jgi:hypothetical protein
VVKRYEVDVTVQKDQENSQQLTFEQWKRKYQQAEMINQNKYLKWKTKYHDLIKQSQEKEIQNDLGQDQIRFFEIKSEKWKNKYHGLNETNNVNASKYQKWKRKFHSLFNVIQQQNEKNRYGLIQNKYNKWKKISRSFTITSTERFIIKTISKTD